MRVYRTYVPVGNGSIMAYCGQSYESTSVTWDRCLEWADIVISEYTDHYDGELTEWKGISKYYKGGAHDQAPGVPTDLGTTRDDSGVVNALENTGGR